MDKIDKIIERLGHYMHLDAKYYVKNLSYLICANIVSVLFALLLSIAFANFVSKEVYGQYSYILSILGVLAVFTLYGMNIAITQAVARDRDGVFIEGTKERFKWSIFGSIAIFGVGMYYLLNNSILLGKSFMVASLIFPFFYSFQTFSAFLSGKKLFGKLSMYQSIATTFSALITILVIYFSRDLVFILIASLVSHSLFGGYFFNLSRKMAKNDDIDNASISFGKHMTLIAAISDVSLNIDKILLANFLSFEELAIYAFAIALPEQIKSSAKNIATLLLPKLSVMDENLIRNIMIKRFVQLTIFAVLIIVVYIVCAPFIYETLFPTYTESIFYSQIFMLSFITIPSLLITTTFKAKMRKKELYIFNICSPIVLTIMLFVLIPSYGIMGAIIARVLTRLFGLIVILVLFREF